MIHANYIGEAGELRVLSELLLRGFKPSRFVVDAGIDVILENGKSLQIKTCNSQLKTKAGNPYYLVNLTSARYKKGYRKEKTRNMIADFLVVWIIRENAFFIIPSIETDGHRGMGITMTSECKYAKYNGAWDILVLQSKQ